LDVIDIQTEAFGFIVAGSHTTATTMTFLFYHLLHSSRAMEKLVAELDASDPGTRLSSMEGMTENAYFQACIKENLRYTPSFVMPLPRRVPEGGREIAGEFIPEGVSLYVGQTEIDHCIDCESCTSSKQEYIWRRCRSIYS
jgi:cytochrome P450